MVNMTCRRHIFKDRKISKERIQLKRPPYSPAGNLVRFGTGYFLSLENHLAVSRREYAGYKIEQGRLSCAVRSDQTYDCPLLDAHVKLGYGSQATEKFGQPFRFENMRPSFSLPATA